MFAGRTSHFTMHHQTIKPNYLWEGKTTDRLAAHRQGSIACYDGAYKLCKLHKVPVDYV